MLGWMSRSWTAISRLMGVFLQLVDMLPKTDRESARRCVRWGPLRPVPVGPPCKAAKRRGARGPAAGVRSARLLLRRR